MRKKLLTVLTVSAFLVSSLHASWVIVNEDGSSEKLAPCCPKKVVKKVKKVKKPEVCETCDYSKFPPATLLPVGDEKLAPATLQNCGQ